YPHRELFLDGTRECTDLHRLPLSVFEGEFFPAPKPSHAFDIGEHLFLSLVKGLSLNDKVVRLPSGGKGDSDTTVREIIHHGPFLGDPDRTMERAYTASGTKGDMLRDRRKRGACDRRVRIESTKGVEMPLRGPDRFETMRIRKPGAVKEEF